MKPKVKISYVESNSLDELKELTNRELEAIQLNIRNVIKDIKLSYKDNNGYVVMIVYAEVEHDEKESLFESGVMSWDY